MIKKTAKKKSMKMAKRPFGRLPFVIKISKQNKVAARVLEESYKSGVAAAAADSHDLL